MPAECAACGVTQPLIGSDEQGRPVCGPCAGAPGLDFTCRECDRGGEIHGNRRCFSCVLAERARILLAGPGGDVPERDWAVYVGQRAADDREGIDSPEHTKQPAKHTNRH